MEFSRVLDLFWPAAVCWIVAVGLALPRRTDPQRLNGFVLWMTLGILYALIIIELQIEHVL